MPELAKLLKKAEISMLLDGYDDIFSDFDPRPFQERALSDDFLAEARKAIRETKIGTFELNLLIPRHKHNPHEDPVIKDRLHKHCRKMENRLSSEADKAFRKGIVLTILGFLFMMLATYARLQENQNLWYSLTLVILEPSGWFMVWYGLDMIFYLSRANNADLLFYKKMSRAEIHFNPY